MLTSLYSKAKRVLQKNKIFLKINQQMRIQA